MGVSSRERRTGLGLALVRQIAEWHGGHITAFSRLGVEVRGRRPRDRACPCRRRYDEIHPAGIPCHYTLHHVVATAVEDARFRLAR